MGFLTPKVPKPELVEAPQSDDARVRQAAENASQRAALRRDSADTMSSGSVRRRGGLGELMRQSVGK